MLFERFSVPSLGHASYLVGAWNNAGYPVEP